MKAAPLRVGLEIGEPLWRRLLTTGAASFGFRLSEAQVQFFQSYAEELLAWNRRINLTRITIQTDIAVKHFIDSLPGADLLESGWRVIDLGSGGGFPGIPLKIVRPDLKITLVDSVRKKVSFQKHICRQLGLSGIDCLHARIEDLGDDVAHKGAYDAVVSRALTNLKPLCRLAAPFLPAAGLLIAYRGRDNNDNLNQTEKLGDTWQVDIHTYRLPYTQARRSITCCRRRPY